MEKKKVGEMERMRKREEGEERERDRFPAM